MDGQEYVQVHAPWYHPKNQASVCKCVYVVSATCVSSQLTADAHIAFASLQAVDGANVIQASAGHVVSWGSVGTCHHPGWAQWDRMDLKHTYIYNTV